MWHGPTAADLVPALSNRRLGGDAGTRQACRRGGGDRHRPDGDRQGGRNTETLFRARRQDDRPCVVCHAGGFKNEVSRKPAFNDIDVSRVTNLYGTGMTWDFVAKLRAATKAKVVLKGIMTGADAARDSSPPSVRCPRSSRRPREGSPCWWTAACAAAPMPTRRWPWAPRRWASGCPTAGGWRRSGSQGSLPAPGWPCADRATPSGGGRRRRRPGGALSLKSSASTP